MEVLAVPVVDGEIKYYSLILVSEDSQANSLTELRGQRFASADIISTSGWLYPAMWLKERGIDANEFFSEHLLVGSHDRSIRAVAFGYADAAAVHSLVYEQMVKDNPELSKRTRIIQKSPPYGMPPVVVSPEIDPVLKNQLASTLVSMHRDTTGSGVLSELNIDRFVVPEKGLYDDVRMAVNAWESNQ
jgi:phosphonate transport system substrate-binding protein